MVINGRREDIVERDNKVWVNLRCSHNFGLQRLADNLVDMKFP